jgi:hypothetical protein
MRKEFAKKFFALVTPLIVAVSLLLIFGTERPAQAYSCGDPSSGHCYARTKWSLSTSGAITDIFHLPMGCSADCGGFGFVDSEMWVADTQTEGCTSNGFGACWVEAGYSTYTTPFNTTFVYIFWADSRPMTSSTYNEHILGPSDSIADYERFLIVQDGRGEPGIFQVWVWNDGSGAYNGTSTSNGMNPNGIYIGAELAGQGGAYEYANFLRNGDVIEPYSGYGAAVSWWTDTGDVQTGQPPLGIWIAPPTLSPSNDGGWFVTACCQ